MKHQFNACHRSHPSHIIPSHQKTSNNIRGVRFHWPHSWCHRFRRVCGDLRPMSSACYHRHLRHVHLKRIQELRWSHSFVDPSIDSSLATTLSLVVFFTWSPPFSFLSDPTTIPPVTSFSFPLSRRRIWFWERLSSSSWNKRGVNCDGTECTTNNIQDKGGVGKGGVNFGEGGVGVVLGEGGVAGVGEVDIEKKGGVSYLLSVFDVHKGGVVLFSSAIFFGLLRFLSCDGFTLTASSIFLSPVFHSICSAWSFYHRPVRHASSFLFTEQPHSGNDQQHVYFSEKVERLLANQTKPITVGGEDGKMHPNWLLADTGAGCTVISDQRLLKKIRTAKYGRSMTIFCNTGRVTTRQIGFLPGYGMVWFNPKGIENIISISEAAKRCRVTMDTAKDNAILIHCKYAPPWRFQITTAGLYCCDARTLTTKASSTVHAITTVEKQEQYFSALDVR